MDTRDIDMVECHHLMHLPLSLDLLYHLQLVLRPDYLFGSLNSQYYDVRSALQPNQKIATTLFSIRHEHPFIVENCIMETNSKKIK